MDDLENKATLEAEQKAKDEAEAKSKAQDDETKDDQDSGGKSTNTDNQKDLEEELERERDARKKAEDALAAKRFNNSKKKRQQSDNDDDDSEEYDDDDRPLTQRDVERILAEDRQATQKEIRLSEAERIAGSLSSSEVEKKLVMEIFRNRTFPSHLSLTEQVEESYAIANRKRLIGERNEALRALSGKSGSNNNPAQTHHDAQQGSSPKMDTNDAKALTAVGYVWNNVSRRYEKKLSNGKTLVHDPKSKKTFIQ